MNFLTIIKSYIINSSFDFLLNFLVSQLMLIRAYMKNMNYIILQSILELAYDFPTVINVIFFNFKIFYMKSFFYSIIVWLESVSHIHRIP